MFAGVRGSHGIQVPCCGSHCIQSQVSESHDARGYARLQILTVQQLLDGKQPEYPARRDATFKQAPRAKKEKATNLVLELDSSISQT